MFFYLSFSQIRFRYSKHQKAEIPQKFNKEFDSLFREKLVTEKSRKLAKVHQNIADEFDSYSRIQ